MTGYQSRILKPSIVSISPLAHVFQNRTVCSIVWGIRPRWGMSSAHVPIISKICYLCLFHLTSETWLLKRIQLY